VVTRRDIPPGAQACQATHAALEFAFTHPEIAVGWHRSSNVVVLLGVPDELHLTWLVADVAAAGLRVAPFHEPDLGGSLTAAALEPAAKRHVSRLPLLFGGREEVKR
jgi:hypothetical protein